MLFSAALAEKMRIEKEEVQARRQRDAERQQAEMEAQMKEAEEQKTSTGRDLILSINCELQTTKVLVLSTYTSISFEKKQYCWDPKQN